MMYVIALNDSVDTYMGQRVRAYREKKGMSQQQLAEATGISWDYICHYEAGTRRMLVSRMHDIAETLGVTIDHFILHVDRHVMPIALKTRLHRLDALLARVAARQKLQKGKKPRPTGRKQAKCSL
ncbi:MAG: helix-turn-helix transcriptional regulator [Kordiimonadaceae bacterium]|nr:helix-turn-helix transcriptional regulator [Kordiimonadaceae bacterium]